MTMANSLSQNIQQRETPIHRGGASITRQSWLTLRRVVGIAVVELRLQLRSKTYWIVLLLLCLLNGLIIWGLARSMPVTDQNQLVVKAASAAVDWVLLLQPFLLMGIFRRDQQRKITPFLWTRPLTSASYILGKALAVVVLVVVLEFQTLLVSWVVASITIGAVLPPLPWLTLFAFTSCSVMLGGLFALCCIALSPVPLLGVLLAVGVAIYHDMFLSQTLLQPVDLGLSAAYYSPSISFGPDGPLVLWQTICVLLVILLCLGLLVLIYQLRQRRGIVFARHWLLSVLLLVCTIVALMPAYQAFLATTQHYRDFGLAEADPIFATISHYRVAVTADPRSGQLQGRASFTITPDKAGNATLYLLLNPGIRVRSVSLGTGDQDTSLKSFSYHSAGGWTKLAVQNTGFMQGRAIHISMLYDGTLTTSRDNYAQAVVRSGSSSSASNTTTLSYLGQGVGMLKGLAGQWYPLPWTQQALIVHGDRFPIEEARVRLPAALKVFSTVKPVLSADKAWQDITVRNMRLPQAFVATLASPVQNDSTDGPIFSNTTPLSQNIVLLYRNDLRQMRAIEHWLAPAAASQPLQVVVMPLLREPVVGPGLLMIPETQFSTSNLPVDPAIFRSPDSEGALRAAGDPVASVWLTNVFLTPPVVGNEREYQIPTLSIAPSMEFTATSDGISQLLSEYIATVTTDGISGHNYWQRVMNVCQQEYDLMFTAKGRQESRTMMGDPFIPQMFQLGLMYCDNRLLGLMHVVQHYGHDRVDSFIPQFIARHQQASTDGYTFMQELGRYLGHDLGLEAAPYMCRSPKEQLDQKSTVKTLDCLKGNTDQKVHVY